MSSEARTEQLRALVAGSERMLQLAESGDWEDVARLQELRQQLAERFFATPVGDQEAADVAVAIRQILANDTKIAALGRQQHEYLQERLKDFSSRRNAARQYSANQSQQDFHTPARS